MPGDIQVTPVADPAFETVAPAPDAQALQSVARAIAADCCREAEKYLEEVRVAVGGE
jgi:hypothetical protein